MTLANLIGLKRQSYKSKLYVDVKRLHLDRLFSLGPLDGERGIM